MSTILLCLHCMNYVDTLYCYQNCSGLCSFPFSSSFSTFPSLSVTRFFSIEASAIDLKLQHKVETGPSCNRNILQKSDRGSGTGEVCWKERGIPIYYRSDVSLQLHRGMPTMTNCEGGGSTAAAAADGRCVSVLSPLLAHHCYNSINVVLFLITLKPSR